MKFDTLFARSSKLSRPFPRQRLMTGHVLAVDMVQRRAIRARASRQSRRL